MRAWRLGVGSIALACALACLGDVQARAVVPFTEEAIARGIDYTSTATPGKGRGLAFIDLDDDGDADVVTLGAASGLVGLFENDGGGTFADRTLTSGIPALVEAAGVIAADHDRDGDLDLYISCFGAANRLFRNDGDLHFVDVTDSTGVGDDGLSHGCGWGDYNNDGLIDLYVANQDGPNRLFKNQGDGTFADFAPQLGVDLNVLGNGDNIEGSFQAGFLDFDRDADADLYVTKIKGYCGDTPTPGGHLFENLGGVFVEITEEANAEACVDSMCLAIGDFDGNGFPDLYQTGVPLGNSLLLNDGNGTFTPSEISSGTISYALGWGSVFLDYNNDAVTDLFVCNSVDPERLYDHGGSFPCVDMSETMGIGEAGRAYSCAVADIDLDGDVDLLVQIQDEPVKLYVNHEGQSRHWARFDVRGEAGQRYAIGAHIEVTTGRTSQVREVIAGCNYKNQNELVQQVGLDDATMIDEVVAVWPGGTTRTLTGLAADATWTIHPPDAIGDADGNGSRDLNDFGAMAVCHTGHAPGALEPGCEVMDHEADGDIDVGDLALFLAQYEGPLNDCNGNGTLDLEEILTGAAPDLDHNGQIDACQVPADVDADGAVGIGDLLTILAEWGPCTSICPPVCVSDLDGDCAVGASDLLSVLIGWGAP